MVGQLSKRNKTTSARRSFALVIGDLESHRESLRRGSIDFELTVWGPTAWPPIQSLGRTTIDLYEQVDLRRFLSISTTSNSEHLAGLTEINSKSRRTYPYQSTFECSELSGGANWRLSGSIASPRQSYKRYAAFSRMPSWVMPSAMKASVSFLFRRFVAKDSCA
jgi:hypothetical protein